MDALKNSEYHKAQWEKQSKLAKEYAKKADEALAASKKHWVYHQRFDAIYREQLKYKNEEVKLQKDVEKVVQGMVDYVVGKELYEHEQELNKSFEDEFEINWTEINETE